MKIFNLIDNYAATISSKSSKNKKERKRVKIKSEKNNMKAYTENFKI